MPILESELLIKFFWNHKFITHPFKNVCILQALQTQTHTHRCQTSISPVSYIRNLIKWVFFTCDGEISSLTTEHDRNRQEDAFMSLRGGRNKYYPPWHFLGFFFSLVSYLSARPTFLFLITLSTCWSLLNNKCTCVKRRMKANPLHLKKKRQLGKKKSITIFFSF